MATQREKIKNTFTTSETSDYVRELEAGNQEARTKRFKLLIASGLSVAVLVGGAYGILKDPSDWKEWTQTVAVAAPQKNQILSKVEQQKINLESTYAQNKKGIVDLQKFKEVAVTLKKNPEQLTAFYTQNERLYKEADKQIAEDKKLLSGLFIISDLNTKFQANIKDDKVENDLTKAKKQYFSSESIALLGQYQSNSPNRTATLSKLGENIAARGKELETIYNEISAEVNKGLANKDKIDFSLGEKAFLDSAQQEVNGQKTQIQNAKSAGDLADSDYQELVKDTDNAYSEISKSVAGDKAKVDELMKKYGSSNVKTASNSDGSQTIIVQEKSSGMSFTEMWLLSQWMGSSTPSYNSGYNAGVAAASNSNASVYGANSKPGSPTVAGVNGLTAQKSYSSLYSMNNPQSSVGQKLASSNMFKGSASATGGGYNTLSQKIAARRNAAITARAEAASLSAKQAAARANSSTNSAKSSGGMGRTGSSMGGSSTS